ncbi:MAG: PHB depolymerase family esterase [Planctomycetota bacterium]
MIYLVILLQALAHAASFQGIPEDLQVHYRSEIEQLRGTGYVEACRYDEVLSLLEEARDIAATRRFFAAMTQLCFDHDRGNEWVRELCAALECPELSALESDALPATIEVDRILMQNGRELLGTGGPLSRLFPHTQSRSELVQRYLEPNIGLDGIGWLWIAGDETRKTERMAIPVPKTFVRYLRHERIDAEGRLVVAGELFHPREGTVQGSITLTPVDVRTGGTLFVNEEEGVRCLRRTGDYPELRLYGDYSDEFAKAAGWTPPVAPPDLTAEVPEPLLEIVRELRERAPEIEWWEPFAPANADSLMARTDLVDSDAAASLLRLRLAATYGNDLPAASFADPAAFIELERRVLSFLAGGSFEAVLELEPEWREVAAALRHAPRFTEPPEPGQHDDHYIAFPSSYNPWCKWPLLVVLHGQYAEPRYDYELWAERADRWGMILLCPRYGSTQGASRTRETDESILALVRRYALRANVEPDRIYLTGLSMGGGMTWGLAMDYPSYWAAAGPEAHGPLVDEKREIPRLVNVRRLPFFMLEGEFDGYNTLFSRKAFQQLTKWKAPCEYHELELYGHSRITWHHPDMLEFFTRHRRDAHPTEIEHHAMHRHRGEHAWLAIRDIEEPLSWDKTDGQYATRDLAGVKASYRKGVINVERIEGKPSEVEIFYDDRLMAPELKIKAGGKTTKWTAKPSVRRMLERVRETGDRERVYGDSIVVRLR